MNARIPRPSPAMVIAMIALFISLGGSAVAVTQGGTERGADRAAHRGKLTLRFGRLIDKDTTAFDGSPFYAIGHAICGKGERVISGGVRQVAGGAAVIPHISGVESGPVPRRRGWYVSMSSDLGGAARKDFVVVVNCERK
jgi:hypothetical protein